MSEGPISLTVLKKPSWSYSLHGSGNDSKVLLRGNATMPKERPNVNIGQVIRSYRGKRNLSQGDIERSTGLLRCYLSRVENGHTVPSLETLAKIAGAMKINLADFFPGSDSVQDRETHKILSGLSQEEIRFLTEIHKCSATLSKDDKNLFLGVIRKMAIVVPVSRVGKSVTGAPRTEY
jgi:transcriptional regulator with XRE-family HTH domain